MLRIPPNHAKAQEAGVSLRSAEDWRIETDPNYSSANAYQNRILLKKQSEKLNHKSFLQNVHENSRKMREELRGGSS